MSNGKNTGRIELTPGQMKKIARYELTFQEVIGEPCTEDIDVVCPHVYTYTLDDLTEAVKNLKKKNPTVKDFGEFWFYPINRLEEAFDLDRARGDLEGEDDTPEELKDYDGLPVSDSTWFNDIWYELENAWSDFRDETHITEALDLDAILADLERYAANKGRPITEWVFTSQEKEYYVESFESDDRVKKASDRELVLARKMTDELCEEGNETALHLKGYACYGGNRLYECDWPASRDCILRLFEMTDDPQYANTLGYIFYYGRCTGGLPEYEKALHYFSIAAANGLYEGAYKLADLYAHGYGCKKSEKTALALYNMVYADSIRHFLQGDDANFADAALRMGNVCAQGIGEEADPEAAYAYYKEAEYAAGIRASHSDFFGNTTVVINIQKALEETKEKLPDDYFRDYLEYSFPVLLTDLAEDRYRCLLTRKLNDDGSWTLQGSRLSTRACRTPEFILIALPQIGICERTIKASVTAFGSVSIWFRDDAEAVRYDCVERNGVEDRYDFYYDDELTAWIRCESFRICGRAKQEPSGPEYRLVSVRFSESGRTYDYICGFEDVHVGDVVIVNGYNGETAVTVTDVRIKKESELGLPADRYKKILRKES